MLGRARRKVSAIYLRLWTSHSNALSLYIFTRNDNRLLLRVAPSEGWLLSVHCHIRKRSLTSVTVSKGPLPFFRCQFLVWW